MSKELTAQEIFDTVARHLLKQGRQSASVTLNSEGNETRRCDYRGPDGTKCAVGVLIADDEYSPEMEANNVDRLCEKGLLPKRLVAHRKLLKDLQMIHDSAPYSHFAMHVKSCMRVIANRSGISASVLNEVAP